MTTTMKSILIVTILTGMISACSSISVLDPRTFNPDRLGNRSVIFGSITLLRQGVPLKLGETYLGNNWFSITLKNIRTGEYFILVELPQDGRYYLALEPGEYTVDDWTFATDGPNIRCHSQDLYFTVPPRSFIYLGDLAINLEIKGKLEYTIKDDFVNASYFFYERFPGFIPELSKNFIQIHSKNDYYFYIQEPG